MWRGSTEGAIRIPSHRWQVWAWCCAFPRIFFLHFWFKMGHFCSKILCSNKQAASASAPLRKYVTELVAFIKSNAVSCLLLHQFCRLAFDLQHSKMGSSAVIGTVAENYFVERLKIRSRKFVQDLLPKPPRQRVEATINFLERIVQSFNLTVCL